MNFSECELAILRIQVDKAQEKIAKRVVNTPEIQKIISIVEKFIKNKKLVCYGGIAINAILPDEDKIYKKDVDLPDYDFFSHNALKDAKELADIYAKEGYTEVEAKAGQHHGTFKVFVNFLGVADITYIPEELFNTVKRSAVNVDGILYTDANFLRMGMFLELSRPSGDTDRWEKVMKRLALVNKYYPLEISNCKSIDFQRPMEDEEKINNIYETVKNTLIEEGVVFFGSYAISYYSQYMPKKLRKKIQHIPDFDVLAHHPKKLANLIKDQLIQEGIKNVKIIKNASIGEVVPENYEVKVGNDTILFIYKPVACHSYNVLMIEGQKVKIATIDTMLSFYLAFLYANRPYYNTERILCMSKFLYDVQQENRLEQKGLLRRFSIICYGHQESREDMRAEKTKAFQKLKNKKESKEYEEWFLNYKPITKVIVLKENNNKNNNNKNKNNKSKKIKINVNKQNKTKRNKSKQIKIKVNKTNKTKRNSNSDITSHSTSTSTSSNTTSASSYNKNK
jgi:hypothetical protein